MNFVLILKHFECSLSGVLDRKRFAISKFVELSHIASSCLTAVREGSVCVRSTVDGATRIGDRLGAAACHNAEHGSDNGQH